jgi:integrase
MPVKTLSQKEVDKITGTDKLVHYFDTNITGFGVDAKMNNKSYFVRGRVNGRLISHTFAKCNVMTFDDAKKKAKALLVKIDAGIHPAEEEKQKVLAAVADKKKNFTLLQILNEYIENNKLKDSTKENYRINIQVYLEDWLNTPLRLITEQDIKARHKQLSIKVELPQKPDSKAPAKKDKLKRIRRNGPGIADGVMKTLRALFTYAIEEHKITTVNPVTPALKKKWNRLPARKGCLRPDQLGPWLKAALESKNANMRDALILMLFTGLRSKSEAFPLMWKHIDFTAKTMHFLDTKNSIDLELPMSSFVQKLITLRKNNHNESEYVFTSSITTTDADGNISKIHIKDVRDELAKINQKAGVAVTAHDLRRTFINIAEGLEISGYTIKALVNHSMEEKIDVTAGYIFISVERKRAALRKITNYILKTAGVTEKDLDRLLP